jgi:hypothetical protein
MNTNLIPVQDVQTMAIAVAKSGLFGMKTPEQALALMLVAQSEGLHPARAAMEYHVIQGRPALKADAMLSRFQNAGGKVEWKCYTDEKVEGVFSHPLGGSITIDWTIDRAKQAGVYGKNPTWKAYPRSMLRARCISEGIRTVYPGVSVGIYTPEEVADFEGPDKAKDVTPAATPMPEKVKAAAKPKPVEPATIEGTATVVHARGTISGDPSEGDLTGIAGDCVKPSGEVLSKVIHAFASIGFTAEMLESEYGKPLDQWVEDDIPEARELLKALKITAANAKAQAADMAANPDTGEI